MLFKNLLCKKRELKFENIQSILVIELSRMGDVISMIPPIICMFENFLNAKINFVIDEKYTNLLRHLLKNYNIEKKRFNIIGFSSTDTIRGLRRAKRLLENYSFDLICSISPSFRNGYLALSLKSIFKIGFFRSYSIYTPFLTMNRVEAIGINNFTPKCFKNENIQERGVKICNALGLAKTGKYTKSLYFSHNNKGIKVQKPYIIIHPFSGWKYRSWNYINYANLIKNILNKFDISFVIIGSPDELDTGEEIRKIVDHKNIFLIFEKELDVMLNLLPNAELFIGNDSGPMHLASFFNVRSIGIYGPAPPTLTAPQKDDNIYFYKKVECSPCKQIKCVRPNNTCMDQITLEEVSNKVIDILNLKLNLCK